ncbi:MAG: S-adenosylmethionine decarboxylase, partial [Candidatus Aenigmatarchaeota archaeon]
MLGPHLTLDFYNCNKENLKNAEFIYSILDELPDIIGMTKLTKPSLLIYEGKENSFDKGGISGFVIIAESHICIHCLGVQWFASVDIFSCKDFDFEKVTV